MVASRYRNNGYTLIIEDRSDYLYASVTGQKGRKADREAAEYYISEIAAECKSLDCPLLLVEKNIPKTLWIWDSVSLVDELTLRGLSKTRVALIDASAGKFGGNGFGVVVGTHGDIDIRVFNNFAAGECWLTKNRKKKTR